MPPRRKCADCGALVPRDAHGRDEVCFCKRPLFVKDGEEPKQKLDKIGSGLARIKALRLQQDRAIEDLWKRYLADCKKHGVEPVKEGA